MSSKRLTALLILSFLLVLSCDSDDSVSPGDNITDGTGLFKILLTDAPAVYDEVNVTFSEVAVHLGEIDGEDPENGEEEPPAQKVAEEWIIIAGESQSYNLLELSNGVTAVLGEQELEVGHYTQIRIMIEDANVVIGGSTYVLTIPSKTVKFVSGFDVVEGTPTELVADFDASRSIHTTGKNEEYKMKPTIRLINNKQLGGIMGQVTNYMHQPIACAIAGDDTVTTSYANKNTGKFTLGFLEAGGYTVAVSDTIGQSYTNNAVTVTAGTKNNLGDITLTLQ